MHWVTQVGYHFIITIQSHDFTNDLYKPELMTTLQFSLLTHAQTFAICSPSCFRESSYLSKKHAQNIRLVIMSMLRKCLWRPWIAIQSAQCYQSKHRLQFINWLPFVPMPKFQSMKKHCTKDDLWQQTYHAHNHKTLVSPRQWCWCSLLAAVQELFQEPLQALSCVLPIASNSIPCWFAAAALTWQLPTRLEAECYCNIDRFC